MTYEEMVELARGFPDVTEDVGRGRNLRRAGRNMMALKEDEVITVKVDWDLHDELLAEEPGIFFKTPHYEGHPWLLARLADLTPALAHRLVEASWRDAPKPGKRRPTG